MQEWTLEPFQPEYAREEQGRGVSPELEATAQKKKEEMVKNEEVEGVMRRKAHSEDTINCSSPTGTQILIASCLAI